MLARIVRASILHNRRRLSVALAAILVPAALVTAVANFVLDARAKMHRELRRRGPNLTIIGDVAELPGLATRRTRATALLPEGVEVPVIGIDAAARQLYPGWRVEGEWGCMVGARLAERLGVRPGERLLDRHIDGILETGEMEDDAILVPRDPSAPVERIDASVPGTVEEVEETARRIEAAHPGVEARVQRQLAESEQALLDKLMLTFGLVAFLVGAVSTLSRALSLAAAVAQRRHEFALLRALGAAGRAIVGLLVAEMGALLVVGVALGAGIGLGLSAWLAQAVFGEDVTVRPFAVVAAAVACMLVTAAAAIVPVRRALAVEPARVLKEE
ncbi:MAG: FtsX-like permease family protein [Planctomycetes bacterium]|nr:FtsX-like permease family protein [Planctomycetota bacterium]